MAATRTIETDYVVVGCGAAGMAFTDSLVSESRADVVMIDRRHAPGGHWNEAYPFVRLHQPSAYYGVNSMTLGADAIDGHGPNQGMYERASAAEICGYYDRVMQQRLLASGQVRWFPMSDYLGDHRFVSRLSGTEYDVKVRQRLVDARYLEGSVPASSPPPFDVAAEARCVPVGDLAYVAEPAAGYVIIGAGKTALDACTWLLDNDVPSDAITWVKPREAWFLNRAFMQGGELVSTLFQGISLQLEAAAQATSVDDLFVRLESRGQMLRVDQTVNPTMFRGPTVSEAEVDQLRSIERVVRLGKVRRIERDALVLDEGDVPTSRHHLHVHCAAPGLNPAPAQPIFTPDRITLQSIRTGLLPFAAALVGFVEATRDDVADKNRLCPPNRQPNIPLDWLRGTLIGMNAEGLWSRESDLAGWLEHARLNPSSGLRRRLAEPEMREAGARFATNVRPGLANLERLTGEATTSR